MIKKFLVTLLFLAALTTGRAQLAITEISSSSATNLGPTILPARSDWWELSNFGTNALDLTGYRWNDNVAA